jgi:hypothetical protein
MATFLTCTHREGVHVKNVGNSGFSQVEGLPRLQQSQPDGEQAGHGYRQARLRPVRAPHVAATWGFDDQSVAARRYCRPRPLQQLADLYQRQLLPHRLLDVGLPLRQQLPRRPPRTAPPLGRVGHRPAASHPAVLQPRLLRGTDIPASPSSRSSLHRPAGRLPSPASHARRASFTSVTRTPRNAIPAISRNRHKPGKRSRGANNLQPGWSHPPGNNSQQVVPCSWQMTILYVATFRATCFPSRCNPAPAGNL